MGDQRTKAQEKGDLPDITEYVHARVELWGQDEIGTGFLNETQGNSTRTTRQSIILLQTDAFRMHANTTANNLLETPISTSFVSALPRDQI